MAKSNNIKKQAMIKALEESLGVVTPACKKVGITRKTHYQWYKEDEEYREVVDDLDNVSLDFAEAIMYKRIEEKSDTMLIFFLKCKGKKRGYIERQEIENITPASVEINVVSSEIATKLKKYLDG